MSFDPEEITFFAKTDARGQQIPFGIKAKDRTKHVYVIGKTGMGKSTLLENMAVQDIKNGNGLAFIDPHGATAEVLLDYIPEHRVKDVLYFAPFDVANPISFNVMEDVGPEKRHLVVSGLMSVFKKIFVDAWSARMEYILSNTLLALLEYPDATLLGVNRMLSDKHYRKKVVENVKDPAVKSFWVDEFANYNERYMQEAGDSIKNKIGQFTANPLIRNIIGQPHSSFDIRELMDDRKIIIVNLSKGLVGESNANLLGSMLTTRLYLAAMSRADLSSEKLKNTPNFYFYVDEFQSFANATFADILSEARKYKLNLTIAHQYIEQMEEEVRNAVFGNVGTIISFRVGPFDAEVLETVFTPKFLAADIVNLGFAQIYLSLMIDGMGSTPFSAVTLPPIVPGSVSYKDMAIASSREKYAGERAAVELVINAWHEKNFAEERAPREPVTPRPAPSVNGSAPAASQASAEPVGNRATPGVSKGGPSTPRAAASVPKERMSPPVRTPAVSPQIDRQAPDVATQVRATPVSEVKVGLAAALAAAIVSEPLQPVCVSPGVSRVSDAALAKSKPVPRAVTPSVVTESVTVATSDLVEQREVVDVLVHTERTARTVRDATRAPQPLQERVTRPTQTPRPTSGSGERVALPGKNLSDLRSVLKSIASSNAKKPEGGLKVATPVSTSDGTKDALKAALAAAVGVPVEDFKVAQEIAVAAKAEVDAATRQLPQHSHAVTLESAASVSPTPIPEVASGASRTDWGTHEKSPDLLAPKRLERMMRVTGSDRNPLR